MNISAACKATMVFLGIGGIVAGTLIYPKATLICLVAFFIGLIWWLIYATFADQEDARR